MLIDLLKNSLSRRIISVISAVCLFQFSATALEKGQAVVDVNSRLPPQAGASVRFSTGIPEILKMIDAKVDVEIIKAFIKNSLVAYNPSAGEIIAMKDRGVPNEIVTAMIQRGGELRPSLSAPPVSAPARPPYNTAPPYDYGAATDMAPYAPSYPAYPYSYASYPYTSYVYAGYPYYPYYSFSYSYWPYCSSFYGYPYCGFGRYS